MVSSTELNSINRELIATMAPQSPAFLLLACTLIALMATTEGGAPKTVKCKDKKEFPSCRNVKLPCPADCANSCLADCELCKSVCVCNRPGGVCQDPRFVGADGITFYFHGKRDRNFCLLSDSDLHINAHFIGKRNADMTRDFTWVQSIALLFGDHRLFLGAQKTATWDDAIDRLAIALDETPVLLPAQEGATWVSPVTPGLRIVRSDSANAVTVELEGKFKITINVVPITAEESRVHHYGVNGEEDCFAHLELGFKFYSLTKDVHGVLGQTYREDYVSRVKLSATNPIMGGEHKFASTDLFAANCEVARFGNAAAALAMVSNSNAVMCTSGLSGRGIVCKK